MSTGRRSRFARLAGSALATATALTIAPAAAPAAVDTTNADRCDFLDPSHCLYPWPNNHFTVKDASMDSGRKLNLNILSMPKNGDPEASTAGKPIDPTDQNRNDGFSPGQAIITKVPGLDNQEAFERTGAVPITDMARYADPKQPVVVINAKTEKRHPIWAEIDSNPTDPEDVTLIIRPAVNFEEGTRYIVALRKMRDEEGNVIPAGEAFRHYRDNVPSDDPEINKRRKRMNNMFWNLGKAGIERKNLFLVWDFTTASERNLSERMLHIRDDAFAELGDTNLADLQVQGDAPPFTIDDVTVSPTGKIARTIEGKVTVPCYLAFKADPRVEAGAPSCESGTRFVYDPEGKPQRQANQTWDLRFTCRIPRSALEAGAGESRPSLYGHGLLGSRGEIGQGQLQNLGKTYNFTFCATDWIGMACADLPETNPQEFITGILLAVEAGTQPPMANCDIPNVGTLLGDLSNFSTLTDRVQQGMLNQLYLGRAMVHPDGFSSHAAFQVGGDGTDSTASLLDTRRLFYDGNSQGGIIGGSLAAFQVDANRAVLGVPGMNYSTLLRRSVDFDTYAQVMYRAYPNELERPLILGLIQLLWDRAEANGYAHHMTNDPYPNTPKHQVMLQVAFGDHQVANVSAEVEARTIGARAVTPYLEAGRSPYVTTKPWGIPAIKSYPYAGSAIAMFDSDSPTPPTTNLPPREGADPHEHARRSPTARAMKDAFLSIGGKVIPCEPLPCRGFASDPER